jgi:hypothetical protein
MQLDTIYVIHHTHNDIGFTNAPPIFWEMQYRIGNLLKKLKITNGAAEIIK